MGCSGDTGRTCEDVVVARWGIEAEGLGLGWAGGMMKDGVQAAEGAGVWSVQIRS